MPCRPAMEPILLRLLGNGWAGTLCLTTKQEDTAIKTTFTQTGARHLAQGIPNQDAIYCSITPQASIAALADGISAASAAEQGARLCADVLGHLLEQHGPTLCRIEQQEAIDLMIRRLRGCVADAALLANTLPKEMAATLSGVFWTPEQLLTFSLGDCLIVAAGKEGCRVLEQPASAESGGRWVSMPGAEKAASLTSHRNAAAFDFIFLFSDGAWRGQIVEPSGWFRQDISPLLCQGQADQLAEFLQQGQPADDSSFVMLRRPTLTQRK